MKLYCSQSRDCQRPKFMTMYREEDYLQLSGIQHFAFCRRQWALSYIEMQWLENVRTVEGKLLHEKAHDTFRNEKRGAVIINRAVPVFSREMGVSGECDIVEFHKTTEGVPLNGYEGKYIVIPIEYKRGEPKQSDEDKLQLTAQALCLEEMLCTEIAQGYLYYGSTRHRVKIAFDTELRERVREMFEEMHQYSTRQYTPKVKRRKSCNACSLKDICLPAINSDKSGTKYINSILGEED